MPTASPTFDPDAFLAKHPARPAFDPDTFLAKRPDPESAPELDTFAEPVIPARVPAESAWESFKSEFTESPTALATGVGGLSSAFLALPTGPGAIAADIAGGTAAGLAAEAAKKAYMGEEAYMAERAQLEANRAAHPIATGIPYMANFLLSALGGGGVGKKVFTTGAEALAETAAKRELGRAATESGARALREGSARPLLERLAQSATVGARAEGSKGAQEKYLRGNENASVLDSMARGAVTMAGTGLLPDPARFAGSMGFYDVAKQLLAEATKRGVSDAAAMTLAGEMYDHAVHDKPIDLTATAQEMGAGIPANVLQNLLMGALHARGAMLPRGAVPTVDPTRRRNLSAEMDADVAAQKAKLEAEQKAKLEADLAKVAKILTPSETPLPPSPPSAGDEIIYAPWETEGGMPSESAREDNTSDFVKPAPAETPASPAAPIPPPTTTILGQSVSESPVIEFLIKNIVVNKDVPQFKGDGDTKTGVVQPLTGKYERRGTAPVVLWEKLNGEIEIITGRHRLDLARRNGETTIPSQIVREADGFTREHALTFDAESNIRDGQGEVKDYANYFKNSPNLTREQAIARGLLRGAKGAAGYHLGHDATDALYTLYANGQIAEGKAVAIARGAPGDAAAQASAIRKAKAMNAAALYLYTRNLSMLNASRMIGGGEQMGFGDIDQTFADFEKQAEALAKVQADRMAVNTEKIQAAIGAARHPEAARKMGLPVDDPVALNARIAELRAANERLADPDEATWAELRKAAEAEGFSLGAQAEGAQAAEDAAIRARNAAAEEERQRQAEIAAAAERRLVGDNSNVGQGVMLSEDTDLLSGPAALGDETRDVPPGQVLESRRDAESPLGTWDFLSTVPTKIVDKLEAQGAELKRRIANNAANRKGVRQRGLDAISSRLEQEVNRRGDELGLDRNAIDNVRAFAKAVGAHLFNDVALGVKKSNSILDGQQGNYDFAESLVNIFTNTIHRGKFEGTMFHELWHTLSRFVPEHEIAGVKSDLARERAVFIKKNPWAVNLPEGNWGRPISIGQLEFRGINKDTLHKWFTPEIDRVTGETKGYRLRATEETYRLFNTDEYFAERMRELTEKDFLPKENRTFWQRAKDIWSLMMHYAKRAFGRDNVRKLYRDFMQQRFSDMKRGGPLDPASTESSILNALADPVQEKLRDEVKYSVPLAAHNTVLDAVRAAEAAAAKAVPGITPARLKELGLAPDSETAKATVLDAATGAGHTLKPDQKPTDFVGAANRAAAEQVARERLDEAYTDAVKAKTDALTRADEIVREVARKDAALTKLEQRAKDAEALGEAAREGVLETVQKFIRQVPGLAERVGALGAEAKALGEQSWKDYQQAIRGLAEKIKGRKGTFGKGGFFNLVDGMIHEAGLRSEDFRKLTTRQVRDRVMERLTAAGDTMADSPLWKLVDGTPEGNALLDVVTEFARNDNTLLPKIEARRSITELQRLAEQDELNRILDEAGDIRKGIKGALRGATLEERAMVPLRQARSQRAAKLRQADALREKAAVAEAVAPAYKLARDRLTRGYRPKLALADKHTFHVPKDPGVTTENLRTDTEQRATLKLTGDEMTPTKEIFDILKKQSEFLKERERRAAAGDLDALDEAWGQVKSENYELMRLTGLDTVERRINVLSTFLPMQAATRQLESLGLPAGRALAMMLRNYEQVRVAVFGKLDAAGRKTESLRRKAIADIERLVPKAQRDLTAPGRWKKLFYDPALRMLEDRRMTEIGGDSKAQEEAGWQELANQWIADSKLPPEKRGAGKYVQNMDDAAKVIAAMKKVIEHAYETGRTVDKRNRASGIDVEDERVQLENLAGERVNAIRPSREVGLKTFSAGLAEQGTHDWIAANASGWKGLRAVIEGDPKTGAKPLAQMTREEAVAALEPFMGERAVDGFIASVANDGGKELLPAPQHGAADWWPEADPAKTAEAWRTAQGTGAAKVVDFIDRLAAAHDGTRTGEEGAYRARVMDRLEKYFTKLGEMVDPALTQPEGSGRIEGMVGGRMINSRMLEQWPTAWRTYIEWDRARTHQAAEAVAANEAFGRDQVAMANLFRAAERQMLDQVAKLRGLRLRASEELGLQGKAADKWIISQLAKDPRIGTERARAEFDRLETLEERARKNVLSGVKQGLWAAFNGKNSAMKPPRLAQEMVRSMTFGIIQNPMSALMDMSDAMAPVLAFGASPNTVKSGVKIASGVGHDLASGLADFVQLKLWKSEKMRRDYRDYNLIEGGDPLAGRSIREQLGDVVTVLTNKEAGTSLPVRAMQAGRELMGIGISRGGSNPEAGTVIRPFAPKTTAQYSTRRIATFEMWDNMRAAVEAADDWFTKHKMDPTEAPRDPTAKEMGLSGQNARSMDKMLEMIAHDRGLTLRQLVSEMRQMPKGGDILTMPTKEMLSAFTQEHITLDDTKATMPLGAHNNTVLQMTLPLLGWPIRRAQQVARLTNSVAQDVPALSRKRAELVAQGILALGVMSIGGLGMGLVADEYQRKLMGKKRNAFGVADIPDLLAAGDGEKAVQAFLDATNRAGTFGLFGELASAPMNFKEGDTRQLDLGSRIVAGNALTAAARAAMNWYRQGEPEYSSVARPLLSALGGNSMLQYLSLANRAAEKAGTRIPGAMAEAERRWTARLNATNWLRVTGRKIGLNVKKPGNFGTPNEVTPWIAKMTMAAYANDHKGFNEAYRQAVKEARTLKKDKPEQEVKELFAGRHPLRQAFGTLTAMEYAKLLRQLPDDGKLAVRDAVNHFNAYLTALGAKAYQGR